MNEKAPSTAIAAAITIAACGRAASRGRAERSLFGVAVPWSSRVPWALARQVTGVPLAPTTGYEAPFRKAWTPLIQWALVAADDRIRISGAREHNLKDVSLELPRDALIVITGLSGSGKSSLAFDTIYAEGQRRYVESLSAYARQFLGQMDKPDVDSIEGLSPAISIDQKTTSRNPRSTVGTVTEIYDYLRLLWARIGHPHCHSCGAPIAGQSIEQIVDHVMTLDEGTRFMVMAPVVRGPQGRVQGPARGAARRGLHARQDRRRAAPARGRDRARQEVQARHRGGRRPAAMKPDARKRLADSVETAVALAEGIVEIEPVDDGKPRGKGAKQRTRTGALGARESAGHAGLLGEVLVPEAAAPRCPSWSRGSSRSTRRTAPARAARGSAPRWRSTPTWSSTRA